MKNILLTICFAPLILVAVELHPVDDCEQLKRNLSSLVSDIEGQVNYWEYNISDATNAYVKINNAVYDFRQKSRYSAYSDEVKEAYHYCAYNSELQQGLSTVGLLITDMQTALGFEQSALLTSSNLVSSIDCTQCPVGTAATNCCDFTAIITAINDVQTVVEENGRDISQILQVVNRWLPQIEQYLENINDNVQYGFGGVTNTMLSINDCLTNLIYDFTQSVDGGFGVTTNILNRLFSLQTGSNLSLTSGFGNVTNLLSDIYGVDSIGWGVSTNYFIDMISPYTSMYWANISPELGTSLSYPYYSSGNFINFRSGLGYFNNFAWQDAPMFYGLAPSVMLMIQELLGASYAQNAWTQYQHDYMYPPITNSLIQIHSDTTNFFSFFRDEIGVQGVLSSWTPERGTYYDYLTNHYLSVVMGDRLSSEFSANTNWFSRIESLLASLVFADAESTNTVSTSSYQSEQTQLRDSARAIQSISQNHMSIVREDVGDILELYQSYVNMYDNITMPQRIVLFTLSNQIDTDTDVVSFSMDDNPGLVAFVEGCRAVTTFCWASVGIFCLLRFVFWAAKGVYYACKFIFSVISSIFK